ncbi:MAG: hypothetical protein Q4G46_16455 [Propionibacteriaceae bacterium]|nr:hypothetical protein [Propionibacteriaceae bacterium]
MFDSAQVYADELATVVEPGERVLNATMVSYLPGRERRGRPDSVTFDPINGLDSSRLNDAAVEAMGGTSLHGADGSLADQLSNVIGAASHLVITDRRVLVVDLGTGSAKLRWSAPRAAIVSMEWAPRLLQRGRVRVQLADGSTVLVVAGMLSGGAAKRLVAAGFGG